MEPFDLDMTAKVKLSKINFLARNPKEHDLGAIIHSIKTFGFIAPPVLNTVTDRLLAGHGRVKALRAMRAAGDEAPDGVLDIGDDWLVPVHEVFIEREREEAVALALNRIQERGGWDFTLLLTVTKDLATHKLLEDMPGEVDLLLASGFDNHDVHALVQKAKQGGDDEQPTGKTYSFTCPKCSHKWEG